MHDIRAENIDDYIAAFPPRDPDAPRGTPRDDPGAQGVR